MPLVKKSFTQSGKTTNLLGFVSGSLIIIIALVLIFIGAAGVAIYFYVQYQQTQAQLNKTTQANVQAALVDAVGKLIVLPTGEQPTIATVSDINKLKSQPFFLHARNGDKVLIYTKAQEAILYDPIANKIVEVGPVALTQVSPTPQGGSVASVGPVKVAIYNGTSVVGLASNKAIILKQQMPSVIIVAKSDAQKSTYTTTVVADLTGKEASQAAAVAKILNGKVGKLPVGETKPASAEIVVIIGK
jgi:hypothetical protein